MAHSFKISNFRIEKKIQAFLIEWIHIKVFRKKQQDSHKRIRNKKKNRYFSLTQ